MKFLFQSTPKLRTHNSKVFWIAFVLHTETIWPWSCYFSVDLLYGRVSVTLLHKFSANIQLTHPSGQAEQLAANPKENSVGEASPQRFSVPLPGQKKPVVHPRHRGLEVEFKAIIEKEDLRYFSTRCREAKNQNSCFSCDVTAAMLVYRTILGDVTAAMLVYRTIAKKVFLGLLIL